MTTQPSLPRRITAGILGASGPRRRPPTLEQQRQLPLGRRLLAAVVGIRARPATVPPHTPTRPESPPTAQPTTPPPEADPTPEPTPEAPRPTAPGDDFPAPQHLYSEDRQDYERLLDEALRSAPGRPELAPVLRRFNPEQLRTMALNATSLITAAAAVEYQHYVRVREESSAPAGAGAVAVAVGEPTADVRAGFGAGAVIAVLAPVLTGTAAAIFLLVGYVLKLLTPEPAFAKTMLTTGWVFGAVAAAAMLVAAVGLLHTALRNNATVEDGAGTLPGPAEETARARQAWREALLERGILPFLSAVHTVPDGARQGNHQT
ncbi:hypothetical protein OK074_6937 [Actinobacteria bacterium OK074]|nr:hypothetical protein OK074_6937 [Actinobacteria bacterium OK074]